MEFEEQELEDLQRNVDRRSEITIDELHKRIQVLTSQVKAYRKRLNQVEPCLILKTYPCESCKMPLISYCPRCDKP